MEELMFSCPACREREVRRRCVRVTEVDTFDDRLGGWTEYDYEDVCARCAWRRAVRSRSTMEGLAHYRTRDDRLFYTGKDDLMVGALVGDVRVRVEARAEAVEAVPREDCARLVGRMMEREVGREVEVRFETDVGGWQARLVPVELMRAAVSLAEQLAEVDHARVLVGRRDDAEVIVEVTTHAAKRVARVLVGDVEQWCGNADVLLAAIDAMWRVERARLAAAFAAGSRALADAFEATTAGLELPLAPAEPLGVGLELLARVAPAVHAEVAETRDGVDGAELWRGVRPDLTSSFPAQVAAWTAANRDRAGGAFFLRARPRQVVLLALHDGRQTLYFDAFRDRDLAGLRARLTYAWTHRAAFVDGLSLGDHTFDGTARVRAPGDRPLTLVAIDGDHPTLVLEPRASITVGRSPDNDVPLTDRIISRRQSVLSARSDGWYVRDAQSTGGTYLDHELVRGDAPLHLGDELRLGALSVLVG